MHSLSFTEGAVKDVHPNCARLVYNFYTLKAIEQWINKSHHGVVER